MTDVVVTVPKDRWAEWIEEGDLPGDPTVECPHCLWRGPKNLWLGHRLDGDRLGPGCPDGRVPLEWHFYMGGSAPRDVGRGDRCYVVAHGRLRGYAPIVRVERYSVGWAIVRHGAAVAVTVPEPIVGFRGWRPRWWTYDQEVPFPGWRTEGVP